MNNMSKFLSNGDFPNLMSDSLSEVAFVISANLDATLLASAKICQRV